MEHFGYLHDHTNTNPHHHNLHHYTLNNQPRDKRHWLEEIEMERNGDYQRLKNWHVGGQRIMQQVMLLIH